MDDFNIAALGRIGFHQFFLAQLGELPPGQHPARVSAVQRDAVMVHDGQLARPARLAATGGGLLVGDWVLVSAAGRIERRLEPLNCITRRTVDGQTQGLASNVDTALLVMGLDHDFNPRRIERYIAVARASGVTPLVVLTKADLGAQASERHDSLRERLPRSVEMVSVNGLEPAALTSLLPWLGPGQTLALLGSSGAGKSTLTNTLCGAGQHTGAVRADDSRGRHTTTARSLHLCASGACIIDTPGLRMLAADADAQEVAASFDDIADLAAACHFHDCRHASEPGCAVAGRVDADRLANYNKLVRQALRASQTPLDRIAERGRWKVLVRQAAARGRSKRG